jgi:hypothetical protein
MRIEIKAIDPSAIRYSTCGDWEWLPDGSLQISVPDYGGQDNSAFLVALHEMAEAWMCRKSGITEEEVNSWDIAHPDAIEPAEEEGSPYADEHAIATQVELKVCAGLNMDWNKHNDWVGNAAAEVDRRIDSGVPAPRILLEGSRYWAELHLFALRNPHFCGANEVWLQQWIYSLPFDKCPCEQHLVDFIKANPPDWNDFFTWTILLHNSVNERIGKPIYTPENARKLWLKRSF